MTNELVVSTPAYSEVLINETKVFCPLQDGMVFVPIKPICDALGVSHQKQQEVVKNHPIWGSVITLRVTTGSDGKQYEMLCLPLKYVFGWLMGIDARLVKPEASEALIRYQEAAYERCMIAFLWSLPCRNGN